MKNLMKLGELCEFINGGAWSDKEYVDNGIAVLKVSNCKSQGFDLSNINYLPNSVEEKYKYHQLKSYDVIVTTVGSHPTLVDSAAGRAFIVNEEVSGFYLNQNAVCLRSKDTSILNQRYLGYLARSSEFINFIQMRGRGAANQMRIAIGVIKEFEFLLPNIKIQNKISSILSAYDDLIGNNQKQIKLLEEAAQRLYKEWFVGLRFPGHEDVEIVDGLPVGWEKVTMDSVAEYLNGFAFKPDDWNVTGKPIIKIKEMTEGISNSTPRNDGVNVPEKYNIKKGDILFSWSATLTAMIWDDEDGLLNQHLFKVTPRKNVSREFMLQSILLTLEEFKNLTTGSTMKHIQRSKLKEVYINMPSTDVMKKFANIAEPIREEVLNIKHKIIYLKEARDRLLPKLMSGEVEV